MSDNNTSRRDHRDLDFPYEFPLTKVVKAHGDDIKVLVLQEPSGDDVLEFGLLEGLSSRQFWPLVCKLAGVPLSTLKTCAGRDMLQLGTVLTGFFNLAAQPPMPSTMPSA